MTTQPTQAEAAQPAPVEQRVSRIEGIVEQVNLRLAENHDDIQALSAKIDAQGETLTAKIDAQTQALRSEMNARFNTVYVLIGGVWATMIGGIIAILVVG